MNKACIYILSALTCGCAERDWLDGWVDDATGQASTASATTQQWRYFAQPAASRLGDGVAVVASGSMDGGAPHFIEHYTREGERTWAIELANFPRGLVATADGGYLVGSSTMEGFAVAHRLSCCGDIVATLEMPELLGDVGWFGLGLDGIYVGVRDASGALTVVRTDLHFNVQWVQALPEVDPWHVGVPATGELVMREVRQLDWLMHTLRADGVLEETVTLPPFDLVQGPGNALTILREGDPVALQPYGFGEAVELDAFEHSRLDAAQGPRFVFATAVEDGVVVVEADADGSLVRRDELRPIRDDGGASISPFGVAMGPDGWVYAAVTESWSGVDPAGGFDTTGFATLHVFAPAE